MAFMEALDRATMERKRRAEWTGRKIVDSPLRPRGDERERSLGAFTPPWDREGSPQFFAGWLVFEGAYATADELPPFCQSKA